MTQHFRGLGLMTPQTGVFNEILLIVVSLSRCCEILYEMRCVILPMLSSILCLTTPRLKDITNIL